MRKRQLYGRWQGLTQRIANEREETLAIEERLPRIGNERQQLLRTSRQRLYSFSSLLFLLLLLLRPSNAFLPFPSRSTITSTTRSTTIHLNAHSSSALRNSNSNTRKKPYQRKVIPITEQRLRETRKQRQQAFEQLTERDLWSFESLFPAPVIDEESVLKDIYRKEDGRDGTYDDEQQRQKQRQDKKLSTQPKWDSSVTSLQKQMIRFLNGGDNSTILAASSSSTTSNTNETVNAELTRMVRDRVYGIRRTKTGELQYDTSLLDTDKGVQFRQGVRLSNPLPINADLLTYWGRKELAHGRVEEAAEFYTRAATIDPRDGRSYLGLSKCASRRRDLALAKKWLQIGVSQSVSVDAVTDLPDRGANPFLLQALGCLEEEMGHLGAAESYYKEAARSRPSHAAAWVSLAQLRTQKLGASASVGRSCFQRAERELKLAGKPPSSFVYTAWAKLEWKKASDRVSARKLFQKALSVDSKCSVAWLQLGILESEDENWEASVQIFQRALGNDKRNSRILQAYALVETKRPGGNSREAIDLFERALAANPRDAGVLQAYALYVAELGDVDAARDLLRQGTQVSKRHAAVWQAWGVLETRFGDPDAARNIFQQGIWACGQWTGNQSGGYNCARLWQAWGVLEAREGDAAAARRCYSRALDADGRNVPAFVAWAQLEESLGKIDDARMVFERALTCFSPGSDEKNSLWRSYELMEQRLANVSSAQSVFQRAMRERMALANDDAQFQEEMESISGLPNVADSIAAKESRDDKNADDSAKMAGKPEIEVVRWKNTGGEVWMNDRRTIEAKIGPLKKQKRLTKETEKSQNDR